MAMSIETRRRPIPGADLRALRRIAEVSQIALARRLGVSRTRLQTIEAAARVTERTAQRYYDALGRVEAGE